MSEGKKVVLVVEDLDRLLLQTQFDAMGLDIEVQVDNSGTGIMGSMIMGLFSNPATKEEAAVVIGKRDYKGDYRADASLLLEKIAKEFNNFCVFHNFKTLRDSIIGKLNYAFSQGPDSGGNPALQDSQREASVTIDAFGEARDLMHKLWLEMLNELKGIKAAVTPVTLKVDMGAKPLMPMDPKLREMLSHSHLSVSSFVDSLRSYLNTVTAEEKPVAELNAWLDFVFKHPEVLKHQMQTYECRPVYTKEALIKELTSALTNNGVMRLFPSTLALNLNAKESAEMLRLLNPKVTFNGTHPGTFTPDSIFEVLLSALREEVPSDVHLCGLSVLRAQERELVIEKLERAIGKHTVKVAGGSKRSFLEGLVNALKEENTFATQITINGAGILSTEELTALTNLFKVGLQDTTEFVDSQSPKEDILEKLTEAFGSDDTNSIVLHNLKGIPGETKRYIYSSLVAAVEKYRELKHIKKEFLVTGARCLAGGNKPANLTFTLGQLGQKWVKEAAGYGVTIEPMALISHLLGQMGVDRENELAAKIFRSEPTEVTVTNVAGATIKMGNQTFSRNEDGSLKIVTRPEGGDNVSTFVLATDGSLKFDSPGYMG